MSMNDAEILAGIRSGNDTEALRHLYRQVLPKVVRFIRSNSGDEEEAYDIFQDAVMIFYKQVKSGNFKEEYQVAGFLYTVCRNRWINRARKKQRQTPLENHDYHLEDPLTIEGEVFSQERESLVEELLSRIGEKCRQLLLYSIFENRSMKEISELMGFGSANAAKTRNYKCKQKLIRIVEDYPALKDQLLNLNT